MARCLVRVTCMLRAFARRCCHNRWLVAWALLSMCCLQAQVIAHNHDAHDHHGHAHDFGGHLHAEQEVHHEDPEESPSHCLLCQSSADNPLLRLASYTSGQVLQQSWIVPTPAPVLLKILLPFQSRGPPLFS